MFLHTVVRGPRSRERAETMGKHAAVRLAAKGLETLKRRRKLFGREPSGSAARDKMIVSTGLNLDVMISSAAQNRCAAAGSNHMSVCGDSVCGDTVLAEQQSPQSAPRRFFALPLPDSFLAGGLRIAA